MSAELEHTYDEYMAPDQQNTGEKPLSKKEEAISSYANTIYKAIEVSVKKFDDNSRLRRLAFENTMGAAILATRSIAETDLTTNFVPTLKSQKEEKLKAGINPADNSVIIEVELEINQNRRSYAEIVREGLEKFVKAHPDVPLHNGISDKYISLKKLFDVLNVPAEDVNKVLDKRIKEQIEDKSVLEVLILMGLSGSHINEMQYLFEYYSPDGISRLTNDAENPINYLDTGFEEKVQKIKSFVEEQNLAQNGPISVSEIIYKCLDLTNGDVRQALYLNAHFLKHIARNEVDSEWLRTSILDEYSDFTPFNFLTDQVNVPYPGKLNNFYKGTNRLKAIDDKPKVYFDYNLTNKVGLPYHAAHLTALLSDFPPEFVTAMCMVEYAKYGHMHGITKFLADLRVIKDAYKLRETLKQFSSEQKEVKEEVESIQ